MSKGIPTGGLNMNNEWKTGYEEGFAKGWESAIQHFEKHMFHQAHATNPGEPPVAPVYPPHHNPGTFILNEDERIVNDLTDHTYIV